MSKFIKIFSVAAVAMLLLDGLWIGVLAKDIYTKYLVTLITPHINVVATVLFYAIYIAGIVHFVILPGLKSGKLRNILFQGIFFGIVAYGTYDLTNLATINHWAWQLTIIDMLWGAFITAAVSGISFLIFKRK